MVSTTLSAEYALAAGLAATPLAVVAVSGFVGWSAAPARLATLIAAAIGLALCLDLAVAQGHGRREPQLVLAALVLLGVVVAMAISRSATLAWAMFAAATGLTWALAAVLIFFRLERLF
ncbi:MAG: hypothetical protein CML66_18450 [Rhodobacteraceae bacterium]|nr:hypothetical protein [Paracoccaceae bacterium]QEW20848.1 hypothetical protein LA6_003049 [Marinibacterium anthonyi]